MQSVVELKAIEVVIVKITVFRDATPCSLVEHIGETCYIHVYNTVVLYREFTY